MGDRYVIRYCEDCRKATIHRLDGDRYCCLFCLPMVGAVDCFFESVFADFLNCEIVLKRSAECGKSLHVGLKCRKN